MRVVHVGKYYWPYQRGIETYLKTLSEGLSPLCDLTVLVSNNKHETVEEEICGVRVVRLARRFHLNSTDFLFGLPKKLKELKPDIVHIHLPNPWAETSWKLAGRPGRLFISYHSDIIRQKYLLKLYAPFHRSTLESAEKIIVATPNHIRYSPFLSKLPEEKLESITICAASGLAFAAYLMKEYKNSCNRLINDAVVSEEVTTRIFENVIEIVRNEGKTFESLIEQISTKGGTTEAGISKLQDSNLSEIINQCIDTAYDRVNALKEK